MNLNFVVDDNVLDVIWEENESVKELFKNINKQPLTIDTTIYGGFEQVGSLGFDLPSNDIRLTSQPGDIYLYQGNQIVIFFGSNTWSYTKLGHINMSFEELNELLNKNNAKVHMYFK